MACGGWFVTVAAPSHQQQSFRACFNNAFNYGRVDVILALKQYIHCTCPIFKVLARMIIGGFFFLMYKYNNLMDTATKICTLSFFFNRSHNIFARHLQITIEKIILQARDAITKSHWSSDLEWSHSGACAFQLFEYFCKKLFLPTMSYIPFQKLDNYTFCYSKWQSCLQSYKARYTTISKCRKEIRSWLDVAIFLNIM